MTPARASLLPAPMRAPGIIGKVTTEISHRSSRSSRRKPARSAGALDAEADRQPVDRAAAHQRMDLPRPPDREVELAAHPQAAGILCDGEPAPDRLGRIVLPQHAHTADAAAREARRKGPG